MSDIRDFCPLWGEWEADKKLGEGSFGTVWKVKRNVMGGRVYYAAVKHISIPNDHSEVDRLIGEGVFSDEKSAVLYYRRMLQSIMEEIDAMHKLQGYTNIVTYEDHKIIPKKDGIGYDLFLRMELLTPLTERMRYGMKVSDVVSLGKDIATAIHVLSEHQMIHRDIKPQNIFVNDKEIYKLGDYGTARVLGSGAAAVSRQGTYSYMSPEVYNNQEADTRADIYALGLVLYRLLNGNRLPFLPLQGVLTGEERDAAVGRRISGETIPPPKFADERLSAIVLRACAFRPEHRYQSAMELYEALEAYQPSGLNRLQTVNSVPDDTMVFTTPSENRDGAGPAGGSGGETAAKSRKWILIAIAAVLLGIAGVSILLGGGFGSKPEEISAGAVTETWEIPAEDQPTETVPGSGEFPEERETPLPAEETDEGDRDEPIMIWMPGLETPAAEQDMPTPEPMEQEQTGTPQPTKAPTATPNPTQKTTKAPASTLKPTQKPVKAPTATPKPTKKPTQKPTEKPTPKPTAKPTQKPTAKPTQKPTKKPTQKPTKKPSPTLPVFEHEMGVPPGAQ